MLITGLIEEDFVNYKKASMFIVFPTCTFKCEKDCGIKCCQNSEVAKSTAIEIDTEKLVDRYINNPITHAIVCGGLEPIDSFDDLLELVKLVREKTDDDIVIYTGYNRNEILKEIRILREFPNIIIKFGRFKPNDVHKFDEILGVELASANQYAEKIS
jgi:organic radical activating enzyme